MILRRTSKQEAVLAGARLPELIRLIGRGSYGEVWLARQADQSLCAVKIVRRQSFKDDRPYEREFLGVQKFAPLSQTYDSQLRILQVGRDDREEYFFYLTSPSAAAAIRAAATPAPDSSTLIWMYCGGADPSD